MKELLRSIVLEIAAVIGTQCFAIVEDCESPRQVLSFRGGTPMTRRAMVGIPQRQKIYLPQLLVPTVRMIPIAGRCCRPILVWGIIDAVRHSIPGLRSLAFALEYDLDFLEPFELIINWYPLAFSVEEDWIFCMDQLHPDKADLTYYQRSGNISPSRLHRILLELQLREDAAMEGLPSDTSGIRFKNVVAWDAAADSLVIGGRLSQ